LLIYEADRLGFSFLIAASVVAYTSAFAESAVTAGWQPWLSRRFMPLVVPMLLVGFGYLAGRLWETKLVALRVATALTAACFLAFFCYFSVPVFNHLEYKGIDRQIENLAAKLDNDVVIFTDVFAGEAFGIPLRYQHNVDARRAYNLANYRSLQEIVTKYSKQGRRVIIETRGLYALKTDKRIFDTLKFSKVFEYSLQFPRLGMSFAIRPKHTGIEKHHLTFFYVKLK
jgi:hypothetical protein